MPLNFENFSGISVEAILQDIHAKTLTKTSLLLRLLKQIKSSLAPENMNVGSM